MRRKERYDNAPMRTFFSWIAISDVTLLSAMTGGCSLLKAFNTTTSSSSKNNLQGTHSRQQSDVRTLAHPIA